MQKKINKNEACVVAMYLFAFPMFLDSKLLTFIKKQGVSMYLSYHRTNIIIITIHALYYELVKQIIGYDICTIL